MAGTTRGVIYLVWGRFDQALLDRSIESVRRHHPELPIHVKQLPDGSTLLDKAGMADVAPFDETLFLDADTVVLDRLDWAFAKARERGLACSICECPWARRYAGVGGEVVEYNTGVLFFTRAARPVFDRWAALAREVDSSMIFQQGGQLVRMPRNDQAAFALAVEETGFPLFTLPFNWNFRPRWHLGWYGPIKIWHDYAPIPEPLVGANAEQARPDSVLRFSAARI